MTVYFGARDLLAPPTERAAFSDRQAYMCAELSKLAYFKFEGGHTLQDALEVARDIFKKEDDRKRLALLEQQLSPILSGAPSSAAEGEAALGKILAEAGFELAQVFSVEGTQAYFCTRRISQKSGVDKTVGFLVFRGTEAKDFRDIKSDASAALRKVSVDGEEIEMHSGYLDAFELVRGDIEVALGATKHDQLMITGHSLGGALAVVATRFLASDSTGACYTFGAPPVGTTDVQNRLKTPVYEIINQVDIVPRLPNPWSATALVILLRLLRLVAKAFTGIAALLASSTWDEKVEEFIESMTRYRHTGYVSYLVGPEDAARLRYNVDSFDRLRWWTSMMWKKGFGGFGRMVSDHSIDLYVRKLQSHARSRK